MPEAVIVATARSPIGRAHKGSLVGMRPDDLAATIARAAMDKVPQLGPADFDDLILGCATPRGEQGFNLARVVAVLLGCDHLPATTVTRECASSLQAIRMAFHAISRGEGDAVLCAGVESVSRDVNGSTGFRNPIFAAAPDAGHGPGWRNPRDDGRLPDIYISMGDTAENVARLRGVSRDEQDLFACRSQHLAAKSITSGFFDEEITPVTTPDGQVVTRDDSPRVETTLAGLAALAPVFRPDGSVTAGNCCPLNDGAAAVIVMSMDRSRALGIRPLARIVSSAVSALSPEIMGLGPVEASTRALARAGMTIEDIDRVEINEAFAAQVIPSARDLGIDVGACLNVHGGAIALGHPFGMTGARIATTLLHALQADDKQVGLETMCVGGGQGMAMVFERLS